MIIAIYCRVAEILEGKGAGKRGRYQGKANKLSKRGEADSLLREFIANKAEKGDV